MTGRQNGGNGSGALSGRLGSLWERMNASFGFIPALLVLGGLVLYSIT